MTRNLIRQVIRAHLEEASRARRQQTRAAIAAASDLTTTKSGRVDLAKQIALTGYSLAKDSVGGPPKYGFTMTFVQKVGINPSTGFNTPIALYAYPVTPTMVTHLTGGKNFDIADSMPEIKDEIPDAAEDGWALPFVAEAPYINFFGFKSLEGVYYTSLGIDAGTYKSMIDVLFAWFKSNVDVSNHDFDFRRLLVQAVRHNDHSFSGDVPAPATAMTDYGRLATIWSLSRALSLVKKGADYAVTARLDTPSQSSISLWRSLLLKVGIKAVVDDAGKKLIHKSEPVQMAIMDTAIIEPIQQFDNVTPAVKELKNTDLYWQKNPDKARQKIDYHVKDIKGILAGAATRTGRHIYPMITDFVHNFESAFIRKKTASEIKKLGLTQQIEDLVLRIIPVVDDDQIDDSGDFLPFFYDLTGDKRIIDAIARRLVEHPDNPFGKIAEHIKRIIYDAEPIVVSYIIALCKDAFAKLSGSVSQYPNEADEMIRKLAALRIMQESMNIGQFRQLINPIYKALPDDMKSSSETSVASGRTLSRMEAYLELFGERELKKARGREQDQIHALEKKKLYQPDTTDLYANLGDLYKLRDRLKILLARARRALYGALDLVNDKDNFFKTGSQLSVREYDFAPGQFIQNTIQSATPEQLQKVTDIWLSYVKKIRKALSGPDIPNILNDIGQERPGLRQDSSEYEELFKEKLYYHAQLQVAAIHEAIEDLEKEMTEQIETMDDKRAETSPLYERILFRLL